MSQLYVLFEHASGYALFRVAEFEEVTLFLPQVQNSIHDFSKFKSIVNLTAFQPFRTGREALDNINSLSEGILHPQLQLFLETNVPKSQKKKQPVILGLGDSRLGPLIVETLGIQWSHEGVVPDVIRGIRDNFHQLVKGFKDSNMAFKAQLGLSHHYSRAKVKFNVSRVDNMVVQSISLVDQLDKDINTFSMRIREWYSHHFPELIKVVPENALYIKCVHAIKDRRHLPDNIEEELENILMDSAKAQSIIELARTSMGMEISEMDMENVIYFAERVNALSERRKEILEYMRTKMHNIAPNLAALIGETVGARLISHAGSLIGLAKHPASTVQILGAEKALFRAIKTKGNTPKFGLLYHSTFIGRAAKENKGRISRYLANKCSLASRIDCFSEVPTEVFGQKLRQQVEERIKFYETGTIPSKNIDVMTEAAQEAETLTEKILKKKRKQERKEKKRKFQEAAQSLSESMMDTTIDSSFLEKTFNGSMSTAPELTEEDQQMQIKKKKKKKKTDNSVMESSINDSQTALKSPEDHQVSIKKKKKKKNISSFMESSINDDFSAETEHPDGQQIKKKKKKKKLLNNDISQASELNESSFNQMTESSLNYDASFENPTEEPKKKKKKKRKHSEMLENNVDDHVNTEEALVANNINNTGEEPQTPKKKKKKVK